MFKQIALATAASVALLAGSANALPMFNNGSISILADTNTNSDLGSTTSFTFDPLVFGPNNYFLTSGASDFSIFAPISIVSPFTGFDMGNANTFSFDASLSGFGSFAAGAITNVTFTSTPVGNSTHNLLSFFVTGNYTVGSAYSNAGSVISADETFSLTQTISNSQGPNNAISISATFVSPADLPPPPPSSPEPATLSLFGAALAGLGYAKRHRK